MQKCCSNIGTSRFIHFTARNFIQYDKTFNFRTRNYLYARYPEPTKFVSNTISYFRSLHTRFVLCRSCTKGRFAFVHVRKTYSYRERRRKKGLFTRCTRELPINREYNVRLKDWQLANNEERSYSSSKVSNRIEKSFRTWKLIEK